MELSTAIDHIYDAITVLNTNSTPARRLVGGGVVVDARGRLLMLYSDFANQGWHFPKGGLDEGETTLEGAIREVFEESGGVKAKPFSGGFKFELSPGRVYREPIEFGSPRGEDPKHRTSDKISFGVDELMLEAAKEARVDLEFLAKYKYQIFDELVEREMKVAWVTIPTYHLLTYDSGIGGPSSEADFVAWHNAEIIDSLRPPDKPNGKPKIGGAAKTIIASPGFLDRIRAAQGEAKEAG